MIHTIILTDSDFKNGDNYLETVHNIYAQIFLVKRKDMLKKDTIKRFITEALTHSDAESDNDSNYDS